MLRYWYFCYAIAVLLGVVWMSVSPTLQYATMWRPMARWMLRALATVLTIHALWMLYIAMQGF